MRNAVRPLSVVALLLAWTASGRAAEKWTRLQNEHFVFVGDASERQVRQIAQRLEQFREVMSRILPPAAVASATPTTVFVFESDRSLTPYKPLFEGRPSEVAGYFVSRGTASAIAMNGGAEQAALRIIFHEYAHFMAANTAGEMPLWANEGLAGFYETFETREDGRVAMLGLPHEGHLALLQGSSLMPLRELMAVDHDSALYNEGSRRGVFYAESWALMHYLSLGSPARSGQLREYLQQVKKGVRPEPAFQAAFGSIDGLERELRDYVRRFTFPGLRLTFNEKLNSSGAARGDAINDTEANAYLGELLVMMGRVDEARTRLKAVIARNPASARGTAALGMLELQADHLEAALPLLEQATTLDPANAATHRAWGAALYANSVTHAGDDAAAAAARAKAQTALSHAIELQPGDAELLMMLGHLESASGAHARATMLFERAVSIAPRQDRYRLLLADSLVRQQDYARATSYLGPLLAGTGDPDIKETARDLLAFVAKARGRAAALADPSRPAAPAESAPASRRKTEIGGRFIPEFRAVGAGERRVLGMFTAVDCQRGSVALVIEADGETIRMAADDLAKVTFLSYRPTAPAAVNCGPIAPARVFATFAEDDALTASGMSGRAIAIELLPDDFAPP